MRLLLDTNRYDDLDRGVEESVLVLSRASEVWLPMVVLGELRAGFVGGSRAQLNEQQLSLFLSKPNVDILPITEETTHYYAEVFVALRKAGRPIPTNDIWIAALAIQYNLLLYSRDAHFRAVPGLQQV